MIDLITDTGMGSFLLDTVIWLITIVTIIGLAGWYFINKMWYKYTFIEFDNKGNFRELKAKIIRNKSKIKKFVVKDYNTPEHYLSVKQSNGTWNGKPCRYITWDGQGNLAYGEGFKVDSENYFKTALLEIERSEAVDGSMEAAEKDNMLTTVQKWTIGGMVVVGIFICITVMFTAKMGFEQLDTIASAGAVYKQAGDNFRYSAEIMRSNNVVLLNLANHFNISIEQEFGERIE